MSFTFPDPLVTAEFTAANGITYRWDNDGPGKWVVKSFLHEGVLVDLSPTPPVRPDRPDGPNDGDLWFDTSPDELTPYVYSAHPGAWPPAAPRSRPFPNTSLCRAVCCSIDKSSCSSSFASSLS